MPRVSVLMAVFNGERYLRKAIDSIRNQTFTDFEFIIVEDGSTDGSPAILKDCAKQDTRIRHVQNPSNLGLIDSLNRGLQLARGEYIARQDADDISMPQRLASQVEFMDDHPQVGVLGTWMTNVDEESRRTVWKTPTSHPLICWSLLFNSSIAHATVMVRRCVLDEDIPYRPEMLHSEDYDLWSQLSEKTLMANLPHCLYLRRRHENRVSVRYSATQQETTKHIMHNNMKKLLGAEIREELVSSMWNTICGKMLGSAAELQGAVNLYMGLYAAFLTKHMLDRLSHKEIASDLARRLTRLGLKHIRHWPADAIQILLAGIRLSPRVSFDTYLIELFELVRAQ